MPIGNNLEQFTLQAYTAMTEVIQDTVRLFNGASNGAIILTGGDLQSAFSEEAFYALLTGDLIKSRNPSGTAATTEFSLEHALANKVKVALRTDTLVFTQAWYDWIARDQAEAASVFGIQLAEKIFEARLENAIAMLKACAGTNPNLVRDQSAATGKDGIMSYTNLLLAADLFGDKAQRINCWLMHSRAKTQLIEGNLANTERLFQFGGVNVMSDAEGRPIIFTDVAGLRSGAGTGPDPVLFHTLGLTQAAAIVEQNSDWQDHVDRSNGQENIKDTYQAQWSENYAVKGFAYDVASIDKKVGITPAALAVSANWDQNVTSDKDTFGVQLDTRLVALP